MPFVVLQFAIATLLPVAASAFLFIIDRDKGLSQRMPGLWQLIVGIVFGLVTIAGTELGIETPDAIMNVRDAAPLVAGLLFGGPAGILAGMIGGIERWFAALWGRGFFTRYACSIATMLAGFYAAMLRKYLFDNKRPSWPIAGAVGLVNEVLHLTLIFLTNLDQVQRAYNVAKACAFPMITCNTLAAALSTLVVMLIAKEEIYLTGENLPVREAIHRGMLCSMIIAFVLTTSFTTILQSSLAEASTSALLELNVNDVKEDILLKSDENLLALARRAATLVPSINAAAPELLEDVKEELHVSQVSVINDLGFIEESTDLNAINFNIRSGAQSNEFVSLLDGTKSVYVQEYCGRTVDGKFRKYAGAVIEGGFIQVGSDAELFQADLHDEVNSSVINRHIGEGGFILLVDNAGTVSGRYLFSLHNADNVRAINEYINDRIESSREGALFSLSFLGTDYYAMFGTAEGYKIVALQPKEESDFSRGVAILLGVFTEIIVFALLYLAIYILINRNVVDGIHGINFRLNQIADGNLETEVDVRSSVEFAQLSDDINVTVGVLKRYISEAESRYDQDLEYARAIQSSALPSVFPPYPNHDEFDIYALMRPAKVVGGDFYDFYFIDERHLAFLVADVGGKSIPAAMFMMRAKSVIKSLADTNIPIEKVLEEANNVLCTGNESNMFVTAWMSVLEVDTGRLRSVNAGHNPPAFRKSAQGSFELLHIRRGLILGCMEGVSYHANEMVLEPGDLLFIYTDGVVEARDEGERFYGEERLLKTLDVLREREPNALCKEVLEDVDSYVGDTEQYDDITMLALRYNGHAQSY